VAPTSPSESIMAQTSATSSSFVCFDAASISA
jgi:hypothetical protein